VRRAPVREENASEQVTLIFDAAQRKAPNCTRHQMRRLFVLSCETARYYHRRFFAT
jgi:hypothetical protein